MRKKTMLVILAVLLLCIITGTLLLPNSYERMLNKYIDYYFSLAEESVSKGYVDESVLRSTYIVDAKLFSGDKKILSDTLSDGWYACWLTIYDEDAYKEDGIVYYARIAHTEEHGFSVLGMNYGKPGEELIVENWLNDKPIRASKLRHYKDLDDILA